MLGSSRVRELVTEHAPGAKRLTTYVVEELERFTGERWEQEDDITLLTLERLEAQP
jgi:serine phosphatase RsbU (regulator of sigma subunit)